METRHTRDTYFVFGVYTLETHKFRGLYTKGIREAKYSLEAYLVVTHTFERRHTHFVLVVYAVETHQSRGLYTQDTPVQGSSH